MFLHIDASNGIPIYDQICRQMKFAIAQGAVPPGDLVPSVRELGKTLTLNANTVARAYRDLQADGVLEPLRGEGLRVAKQAPERCRKERQQLLAARLSGAIVECRQAGLDEPALRELIESVLNQTARPGASS